MKPMRPNHCLWDVVCPTCHGVNESRYVRWPRNVFVGLLDLLCVLMIGIPLFKLERVCLRCGARFRSKRVRSYRVCWKCGYNLTGLTEPRCPECGTAFNVMPTDECEQGAG